ncbi:MAG: WXG100 family type VII secretion target [Ruminococcaceae bacterium]|nr:WXG100 family type VII secretion target [Oscillospiraceae bacterium]
MTTINVNDAAMLEKSNEIAMLKNELSHNLKKIEDTVLSMQGDWQGAGEKIFSAKILTVKDQYNDILDFFDDYAKILKGFAESYERQEADLVSKIKMA